MTPVVLSAILQIFGMFAVGWLARRFGYIREQDLDRWSRFAIDILTPALIFHSITQNFEADRFGELWTLPVIGFAIIVLGAVAGMAFRVGVRRESADLQATFHHFCAINNYGFLPMIIVLNLWGEPGLARLFFFTLGSTIGYWTIGVGLLGGDVRTAVRNLVSPSLAALFIALALCGAGWSERVPTVVVNVAGSVGAAAIPCLLILVGAALYPLPPLRHRRALTYLVAVRLLLLPALTIAVIYCLPLAADVRNIAVIVALMPTSVSSTILTRCYGGDPEFAAEAALVTTVLAGVTVPLGLYWLGW